MHPRLKDALSCAITVACIIGITAFGASRSGYPWQWEQVWQYFFTWNADGPQFGVLLREGLLCTLRISIYGLGLSLCAGLAAAILRLAGGSFGRGLSLAYVEVVRNTPLMVQLFVLYAAIPASWGLSAEQIASITLGLFEGAYMAEVFRAGILAVPQGQWEAGQSLGLSLPQCWRHIVLPQAVRHALPPLVNQGVSLVKDSSLASVIAVSELTQQSGLIISDTFLVFEIWLPVAGIYLFLSLVISVLATFLERRLSRGIQPQPDLNG